MKAAILLLSGALCIAPVNAFNIEGNTITLSDAEIGTCNEEDGCALITNKWLKQEKEKAFAKGVTSCKNST